METFASFSEIIGPQSLPGQSIRELRSSPRRGDGESYQTELRLLGDMLVSVSSKQQSSLEERTRSVSTRLSFTSSHLRLCEGFSTGSSSFTVLGACASFQTTFFGTCIALFIPLQAAVQNRLTTVLSCTSAYSQWQRRSPQIQLSAPVMLVGCLRKKQRNTWKKNVRDRALLRFRVCPCSEATTPALVSKRLASYISVSFRSLILLWAFKLSALTQE